MTYLLEVVEGYRFDVGWLLRFDKSR